MRARNAPDSATEAALKNDFQATSVKLKTSEAKLKDFCKETRQDRDRFREQTLGFGHSQASKAVWAERKEVDKAGESGIIEIGKSLGAKAKNYLVMDLSSGEQFRFAEGSHIEKIKVFAGKNSKSVYRKAYVYADKYGGNAEDWQHVKGIGIIDYYGEGRKAEVHWSRHDTYGDFDFFVKEWLE